MINDLFNFVFVNVCNSVLMCVNHVKHTTSAYLTSYKSGFTFY